MSHIPGCQDVMEYLLINQGVSRGTASFLAYLHSMGIRVYFDTNYPNELKFMYDVAFQEMEVYAVAVQLGILAVETVQASAILHSEGFIINSPTTWSRKNKASWGKLDGIIDKILALPEVTVTTDTIIVPDNRLPAFIWLVEYCHFPQTDWGTHGVAADLRYAFSGMKLIESTVMPGAFSLRIK